MQNENGKGIKMKNKFFALLAALLLAVGLPLAANDTPGDLASEITLLVTAVAAPSVLAGPDFIRTAPVAAAVAASPALASPASPSPILPLAVQRPFRDMFRGEKTERAFLNSTLLAMTALNVADYLSTKQALKIPGSYEGNPLMRPFVKNDFAFAAIKAGTTAATYFGMKKLFKRNKTMAWVLTTAASFVSSYAVYSNMRLVRKFRAR
jgi:hypothetical protein